VSKNLSESARAAALELLDKAGLKTGHVVVVGCSTSEIVGHRIGTSSSTDIGVEIFNALDGVFGEVGVYLAAQCCEHLNRAIVIEREAAGNWEVVNAIPTPNAGGSFAAAAYNGFRDPVVLEEIRTDAGLDIGGTLIGMHLKKVAVPIRLSVTHIGEASVMAARVRPKSVGGERTKYNNELG
jgi:uncharacterized protein (TIGR01440 family)